MSLRVSMKKKIKVRSVSRCAIVKVRLSVNVRFGIKFRFIVRVKVGAG